VAAETAAAAGGVDRRSPTAARGATLSEGTIRNYVSTLFEKLGVADRTRAALIALRHGLAD
jgi:DNA-binding NarL/FixJ family response regulator